MRRGLFNSTADVEWRRSPRSSSDPNKGSWRGRCPAGYEVGEATRAGTSFVFGYLGGGPLPFELKAPGSEFILAVQALPIALVMSVLTTLLFYWGILPPIIRAFSRVLERTVGVGGAVGLSTAANVFVGMVEAPLFIRPILIGCRAANCSS